MSNDELSLIFAYLKQILKSDDEYSKKRIKLFIEEIHQPEKKLSLFDDMYWASIEKK